VIVVDTYRGRDIGVLGLARSGLAAARALKAGGANVFAWDESPESRSRAEAAGIHVEDFTQRDWKGFAAVVVSPGVPLRFPKPHRIVEVAEALGVPVIGDIELLAGAINALPPAQRPKVIGITGTNGKSTTTALIGHILKTCGRDAYVGGNIGLGVLDLPPIHAGAHYVLELSSYQLDLTHSLRCNAAVLLNLSPDHLDRHGSMDNYIAAKKRIFLNQELDDWAVVGVDDSITQGICTQLVGQHDRRVAPIASGQTLGRGVSVVGGKLYDSLDGRASEVADLAKAKALRGRHNHQNAAAAYSAARAVGLSPRAIAEALYSFPGLAHRMENAGGIGRVRFVNDSKATNADAASQALASFDRIYWIAGGVAKEGGIESLSGFHSRIAKVYLIGEAAPVFAKTLEHKVPLEICKTMDKAVEAAARDAAEDPAPEPVVLLSPACASFDQYSDFEQRGDAFKNEVNKLIAAAGQAA